MLFGQSPQQQHHRVVTKMPDAVVTRKYAREIRVYASDVNKASTIKAKAMTSRPRPRPHTPKAKAMASRPRP